MDVEPTKPQNVAPMGGLLSEYLACSAPVDIDHKDVRIIT